MGLIKNRARKILTTTKDGEKISTADTDFVKDLLKFHRNANEKVANLDYITVDSHSDHDYSRCFYIVKKDNTKEVNYLNNI